jgi:hypothetical protein
MPKIVRLTENDLMRIVKKVIREQSSNNCDEFLETLNNIIDKYYSELDNLPDLGTSSYNDLHSYHDEVDRVIEMYRRDHGDYMRDNEACWGVDRESLYEIFDKSEDFVNFAESMKKNATDNFISATKLGDIKSTGNRYGGFGPEFYDETEIGAYNKMEKDFDDDEFDTEEFSDFESYREKYPRRTSGVRWFNRDPDETKNKEWFNTFQRNRGGKPFKVKTRKM